MLKDKIAVVTGAARGIGREIALLMAKKGAAVVLRDGEIHLATGTVVDGDPTIDLTAVERITAVFARGVAVV